MDSLNLMELYDSCWFHLEILKTRNRQPSSSNPDCEITKESFKPAEISRIPTISRSMSSDQIRSSDESLIFDSLSPNTVLHVNRTPKLNTILSGKDYTEEKEQESIKELTHEQVKARKISRRRRARIESKSLSELEFEELKGFMDLGFVFSEKDKLNSSLASILPGLQRLGKEDEEKGIYFGHSTIRRPYLSESWKLLEDKKESRTPLLKWRIPNLKNELEIKDNIKCWAHSVASAVK